MYYDEVKINDQVGKPENIKEEKIKINDNDFVSFQSLQLSKLDNNIVIIVTSNNNVNIINDNNMIVTSSCTLVDKDTTFNGSGLDVLFMAIKEKEIDPSRTKPIPTITNWSQAMLKAIKSCKPNIVTKTNKHFESVGRIYSFGNRAIMAYLQCPNMQIRNHQKPPSKMMMMKMTATIMRTTMRMIRAAILLLFKLNTM